jgi:ribonuclease P protein component
MPKKNRLTRADLENLSVVRREHGAYFTLSIGKSEKGGESACACVVSKKIALRAHDRVLIKRRCRAAIRPLISAVPQGESLVFTAKKAAKGATFRDIERDIQQLVSRIHR